MSTERVGADEGGGAVTGAGAEASRSATELVVWCFLAGGIGLSLFALMLPDSPRTTLFDALGIIAGVGALIGVGRNKPSARAPWLCLAIGLMLLVVGDLVFDLADRVFHADPFPWADFVYLSAYPLIGWALYRLAKDRIHRETTIDSAIVAVALSALIWQWVITPVINISQGPTLETIVAVAYPIMDLVLIVVIVHAVFTIPRWNAPAWLLFGGLAVMLIADTVYARQTADGTYVLGGPLDAVWPISYFLLAAAVLHPSMRSLWNARDDEQGLVRDGRARMVVLASALFAAPAVVVLDDSGSAEAVSLALIAGAAATLVAWRIARLVHEANEAREVLGISEARFRALVQHGADIIVVLSEDGYVKYISPSVERVLGLAPSDFLGKRFRDHVDPDATKRAMEHYHALHGKPDRPLIIEFQIWDGVAWRWVESTWTNRLADPAVQGIVGNLRDISDRKRNEAFALAETRVLESILSGAPVEESLMTLVRAVEAAIAGTHGTVVLLDPSSGELQRVATPSLPAEFVARMNGPNLEEIDETLSTSSIHIITEFDRDDARYAERLRICHEFGFHGVWSIPVLRSESGQFVGIFALYQETSREPSANNITLLERARDLIALAVDRAEHTRQLGYLALHDTLTGLPNRALAQERIDAALARLDHSDAMVAVLFLDLDRFKLVNDGLGHDVGDQLLVEVSRRLRAAVRRHDTIARFGGDEFIVICEDLRHEHQAEELAERIAGAFTEPFMLTRAEVAITASVGIAVTKDASERALSLLRDADAAMYRAKRRGGARHVVFDDAMHTQAVSRLLTERGLREALERDEFRVVYQPQFDLQTDDRVAVEALLRWEHPVRGNILPADFIAVAEETGIIIPIGEWVLARACELVRFLPTAGPGGGPLPVSANVSARQLPRASFACAVERVLREYAIDPQLLCLEIAEAVLLDDIDVMSDALHALKDLGVRLSIDDFGTGGSSLTYLRRFPFDELKVDRAFITGLGHSAADDAIVAATIDMAHALGMTVVAEGVESEIQHVRLRELGCDRAQGFHLAPPVEMASRRLVLVEQKPA